MRVSVLGIDLAKSVFQLHGADSAGRQVLRKKLKRKELMPFIANLPPCLIGIEACCACHYWARQFKKHGHMVKLIPAQFVKPFLKGNKNDFNDAEAICEAVQRPNMRFVAEKPLLHQDIQSAHRIRLRLIRSRTALCNEIRGLLAEYGEVIPKSVSKLRKSLPEILCDESNELTAFMREMISELYTELCDLDLRLESFTQKISRIFKENEVCQRLSKIEGVGPLTSTAIVASVPDPSIFKSGRQMSAWLGLVPKQHSSGGKTVLLGISKRGDSYCRMLLVHGARSIVSRAKAKSDERSKWITKKEQTRGANKACVALANKNVRIIWKMMITGEEYRPAV